MTSIGQRFKTGCCRAGPPGERRRPEADIDTSSAGQLSLRNLPVVYNL